jgi:hypothetical protein
MSPTNHDGGPAFPTSRLERVGSDGHTHHEHVDYAGMSLRDWFAGQALEAVIKEYVLRNPGIGTEHLPRNCSAHAYRIADAMLNARDQQERH